MTEVIKKYSEVPINDVNRFLSMLASSQVLEKFNLEERKEEILKLRWVYGFSVEQIAKKYEISDMRAKELITNATGSLLWRLEKMIKGNYKESPTEKDKLITELKSENEDLKKKLKLLNNEQKLKFREMDIQQKEIQSSGLPVKIADTLCYRHDIKLVGELLNFRKKSLLFLDGITVKNFETIMKWLDENKLKMKD